ncbi:hypothetical protein GWK41_03585 [Persephonella atlantica]|uniref:Uncharacterized protein n=1 Tax=Persephonella atlantica TaxID=2699429 RepID=A0ABS1GGU3_9AQUI|nr:hypothetical protein [Persephonella atlantica]MBK3332149.1 hypothetical protein [Persephonella atlantica]
MRFFTVMLLFLLFSASILAEETDSFYEGENVVGFIKDSNGNKYIVIETPEGKAKLIKTEKNPEEILRDSGGITKEDFEIR